MKTQLGDQNAVSETRPPSAPPQAATEEAVAPEPLVLLVRSAEADDAVLDAPPPAADSAAGPPEPGPVIAFIQQGSLTDMTAISSLVDPEQAVVVTAGEDDTLSSLLSSVPADRGSMSSEERVAVFQADDGQLVCLTYTVAPVAGEDGCDTDVVAEVDLDSADTVGSETTVSEPAGVFQEHFILSGLSSSPVAVVPNSLNLQIFPDITNEAGDGKMTPEQVLAKLRVEDRLRVLEQLLPPAPPLARAPRAPPAAPASDAPRPKSLPPLRPRPPAAAAAAAAAAPPAPPAAAAADADADAAPYACDLCGARFQRPEQFYGHLHRHRGERRFRCALCPAAAPDFPTAAQLRAHERRQHPGARPHACARCPATFERASQLGYHARRVHEGERPHSCAVCPKSFFKRSDLHTHLHVHLGIHKSVCETCGRGFGHVSNLIRHARTHSGVRPYPCPDCGRRFGQLNAMLQHRASHDAARREPCPACGRLFKSAAVMRKHARAAHGACPPAAPPGAPAAPRARRFHCAACGDAFAFSALLRQHERQHEAGAAALPCGGCGRACASVEELKTHACAPPARARAPPPHAPAPSPPPLPPPDSAPPAPAPHDLGDSQRLLESLLLGAAEEEEQRQEAQAEQEGGVVVLVAGGDADAQAGDADGAAAVPLLVLRPRTAPPPLPAAPLAPLLPAPPPPPPPPPSPAPAPPAASSADAAAPPRRRAAAFTCSECGKVFLKSGNYKQHLGMHFVDQKKHGCPTCGQLFAWKSTLNKHVARAHARGEAAPRPRCELCGRDYATAAQVQEHVRRDHFLQRPHACPAPACKKRFYKKHDLKVHLRMHNKERPYICGSCGKTFNHLSHIIRHERIHSGLRPYTCSDCGRQFNQSSALKSHRQRHRDKEQQQQIQLRQQQQLCQQQDLEADEEQGAGGVTSLAPSPLDVPELQAADLEPVELDAPSLEVPEDAVSLLPSHGLEVSPPEPLVELTVSDAEMVLGLPTSIIFAQGLFPDVT